MIFKFLLNLLIALLLFLNISYSQNKVQLYLFEIDSCDSYIDSIGATIFDKNKNVYSDLTSEIFKHQGKTYVDSITKLIDKFGYYCILLPDTGIYYYSDKYIDWDSDTFPAEIIHIKKFGKINDTIYNHKLKESFAATHSYFERYSFCGVDCNGYYIDYFKNGNIRAEGNFQNGFIVGKFFKYYMEGGKREEYIFNKNRKTIYKYFKSGKKNEESLYKKRGLKRRYWVNVKEMKFNEDNTIFRVIKQNRHRYIKKVNQFDKSGDLILKFKLKKILSLLYSLDGYNSYIYTLKKYNPKTGKRITKGKFEYWHYCLYDMPEDINKADYVLKYYKYISGRKKEITDGCLMEDFLENHRNFLNK